jgi:hypothetical protein
MVVVEAMSDRLAVDRQKGTARSKRPQRGVAHGCAMFQLLVPILHGLVSRPGATHDAGKLAPLRIAFGSILDESEI